MLLAIDAGNTNTVFAVYDGDALVGSWRCATEVKRTSDEYAVWLTQLMALKAIPPTAIDQAILASVAPETNFNLTRLCDQYFNASPLVVGEPGCDIGLEIALDRPEEVGADRLVNAVAARDRHGDGLIVIDFGTATTFDLIDQAGRYAGGAIAPGINLSLQALYMAAAKLPRVAVRRPEKVIASSTVTAMQSGVFWGYVGLIEGLVSRMRAEAGAALKVVGTGGLAPMFADATDVIAATESDLTLWGLRLINRRNRKLWTGNC